MRIQFINSLLGGDYSALDIAITQLATFINEKTKHRASILDLTFHRREWQKHIHRNINQFKPDVIGMSCNTMYMQYVKTIAKEIKQKYDLPIILGGYHASIKPLETLNIPEATAVCIGDGEFSLAQFLDRYEKGKSAKGITGIWTKENEKIIKNKIGCFIKDIDQFPIPNWDLWHDLKKYFYYLGMLYFIGNRGCPYRCSYCDAHQISQAVEGSYYRLRNPVKYANEILLQWEKYKKKGMRFAQLFDQVPTLNQKWLKSFCEEYKKQGEPEYKFSMFSRIDHLNKKKIKMLSKAGCTILRMGVEAGNDFVRNEVYKKNISKEKIKKIFKLCKEYGIGITAYYMVGGPSETKKTIEETIKLARKLNANRSAIFIFKPFTHESEVLIKKYGDKIDEKRWEKADNITYDAVVKLKNLSPRQVELLQYKAYLYTFGKRLIWMIKSNPVSYFTRFTTYVTKGLKDGLDIKYLIPYYHIYGYDYVNK